VIATLCLLGLYCFVVLYPLSVTEISVAEIVLAFWMLSIILERVRVLSLVGPWVWLKGYWNRCDLFVVRITPAFTNLKSYMVIL
jgi:hypothetical protein